MRINNSMTIAIALAIMIAVSGCTTKTANNQGQVPNDAKNLGCTNDSCSLSTPDNVQNVEIIHFHGNSQCYSCITVGALANETVHTYYSNEILEGKVEFKSINYDFMENKGMAIKYGVTGSSLWIGVYDGQGFHPEENTNVWYKINDRQGYISYLKGIIDKRLKGDFN